MISDSLVSQIEALYRQGNSQRSISRQTGVSRDTVRKVVNGSFAAEAANQLHAPTPVAYPRVPQRCRHCGAMVFLPCRACALRCA